MAPIHLFLSFGPYIIIIIIIIIIVIIIIVIIIIIMFTKLTPFILTSVSFKCIALNEVFFQTLLTWLLHYLLDESIIRPMTSVSIFNGLTRPNTINTDEQAENNQQEFI